MCVCVCVFVCGYVYVRVCLCVCVSLGSAFQSKYVFWGSFRDFTLFSCRLAACLFESSSTRDDCSGPRDLLVSPQWFISVR